MSPMSPADANACLSHVRTKLSEAEYVLAVTRIEQLLSANRTMAQLDMVEAGLPAMFSFSDLPDVVRHDAVATLVSVAQSIRAAYCSGLARGKARGAEQ
jgi:hypothetical protein